MSNPTHVMRARHGAPDQAAAAKPIPASSVPSRPVRVRESLSADAQALLRRLSPELAMTATARDFPHVMNRIAIVFGDATAFEQVMWGLLIDDRPNREGFPFQVANELASLRVYRQERLGRPADGHRDAPAGKADASFDSIPFVRESP